jgi:hypothetical protein
MRWPLAFLACFGFCTAGVGAPLAGAPPLSDQELITALIEALGDPSFEVRDNIAFALGNLGEAVAPKLLDALNDPMPERRQGAAMAIGRIRPGYRPAVPALMRALKDKDDGVRRQASYALSRIVSREILTSVSPGQPPAKVPPIDPTPGPAPARGSQ